MYCLYTGKRKISVENITFYLLKSVQNINNSSWKLDNFVPFGRPQSGPVILQLMAELDVSDNWIPEQQYQNRLESNALFFFTKNPMSQCTYFENI